MATGKEHAPVPHYPGITDFLDGIKNAARGTKRWLTTDWTLGKALKVGGVSTMVIAPAAIWEWNQLHPTVPQEQSTDAPRDIFPQPAQPEIKAVIPWPNETTTPMATPEPSPTTTPTTAPATATATRTATAVPSGYIMENGSLIYRTEKGDILKLPKVPGLEIKLEGNKATYVDKEGRYAGEFVPNVSMATETGKKEQTGGVVLTAPVVKSLIDQKLAASSGPKDKWTISLPLDIRNSDRTISVYFGQQQAGNSVSSFLYIGLSEKIALTNIIPDTKELRIASAIIPGYQGYYDPLLRMEPYTSKIVSGKEMSYIFVLAQLGSAKTIQSAFGDKVGDVSGTVMINHGVANDFSSINPDKVLTIEGAPVFLGANPS